MSTFFVPSTPSQKAAAALLSIGAVGLTPHKPITFKSGIISPVYVDNRILPSHPVEWKTVLTGLVNLIREKHLQPDVIAGIETAGIPHSATLGYMLDLPSVFIRKMSKDHGTKKMVEGGAVQGKKVLLIEDHISTGSSSLHGIEVLKAEGAEVLACLSITSYTFPEAKTAFTAAQVPLYTLAPFPQILEVAQQNSQLSPDEFALIGRWLADPHHWSAA